MISIRNTKIFKCNYIVVTMELSVIYIKELWDYLGSISSDRNYRLSPEDEKDCATKAKLGDAESFRKILASNKGLLFTILKKFAYQASRHQMPLTDIAGELIEKMIQVGVPKYSTHRDRKFGSYLINPEYLNHIIRAIITRQSKQGITYFPQKTIPIYLPLPPEGNSETDHAERTLEEIVSYKELAKLQHTRASTANTATDRIDFEQLRNAIQQLPEREKYIIESHYFNGKTLEEIAKSLHITRQNVHQIMKKRAFKKLRKTLEQK